MVDPLRYYNPKRRRLNEAFDGVQGSEIHLSHVVLTCARSYLILSDVVHVAAVHVNFTF